MLLDLIPYGEKNAISRTMLRVKSGLTDRAMREEISRLRREHPILNSQEGNGYFRPLPEEVQKVEKWLSQEGHRAKSIFWSQKGAREFMKEVGM